MTSVESMRAAQNIVRHAPLGGTRGLRRFDTDVGLAACDATFGGSEPLRSASQAPHHVPSKMLLLRLADAKATSFRAEREERLPARRRDSHA